MHSWLPALAALASLPLCAADAPPRTWIDPDTGHRIVRLTDEPGSASLYFNQNGYTADGKEMVYTTPEGISALNLATRAAHPVVKGRVRIIVTGHKTQNVYYIKDNTVCSTDVDTLATREIAKLPPRGSVATVNADETLLAGTYIVGDGADYNANRPAGAANPRTAAQQGPDDGRAPGRPPPHGPLHHQHPDRRNQNHPRLARTGSTTWNSRPPIPPC